MDFKGEHYALYSKCGAAITFCEITQQNYTSCGSVKNCHGLYVLPGDTFFINIEDKNQAEEISADLSFSGYFNPVTNFIFKPIDSNCIPQQAFQIAIPLLAATGSSFEIVAQNVAYVNNVSANTGIPWPFAIYVGGQQPQFTFALSDFTTCPVIQEVSVKETNSLEFTFNISPNPVTDMLYFESSGNRKEEVNLNYSLSIKDILGREIFKTEFAEQIRVSHLQKGIYFLSLQDGNETLATKRFVKE